MTLESDLLATIREIARGKKINGAPMSGETARQLARGVLITHGLNWPSQERHPSEYQPRPRQA